MPPRKRCPTRSEEISVLEVTEQSQVDNQAQCDLQLMSSSRSRPLHEASYQKVADCNQRPQQEERTDALVVVIVGKQGYKQRTGARAPAQRPLDNPKDDQ